MNAFALCIVFLIAFDDTECSLFNQLSCLQMTVRGLIYCRWSLLFLCSTVGFQFGFGCLYQLIELVIIHGDGEGDS